VTNKPKILLDCDPGLDDAMAIACASRYGHLVGITTVSGNVGLDLTTANALTVCEVFDIDVAVHAGAAHALDGATPDAAEVHGKTGLDGPVHPPHNRTVDGHDAVEFIIETIRAHPGLWLVPIGPMTNIAKVLQVAPRALDDVAGISFMGGARSVGNASPVAEFNVWGDPEAAAQVLGCGHPTIRMSGLQLTEQFLVDDAFLARVRSIDTDRARWSFDLLNFLLGAVELLGGNRATAMHDPVAVLSVTHPELVVAEPRWVAVELHGTHTRGMTVVDQRDRHQDDRHPDSAVIEVGMTIDGAAMADLLLECLTPPAPR